MLHRSSIAILITTLFILLLFLAMLLWLRQLKSEESLETVNDLIQEVRQEFGQKKWKGYDISESARILEETEKYYDQNNFTKALELLDATQQTLKRAQLLYPDHATSLATRPPYGHFLFIPWSSYSPSSEEVLWAAERYDIFILHANRADLIPAIRKKNSAAQIYLYVNLLIRQDDDLLDESIGQYDWIAKNHPEWFLKNPENQPLLSHEEYDYYWLDPGNTEWQTFFIQKLSEKIALSQETWDGIFLDHVRYTLDNPNDDTPKIASYPTEENYQEAVLSFVRAVSETFHAEKLKILGNVEQVNAALPPFWTKFIDIADGAMNEIFVRTSFNDLEKGYHTATTWKQQLEQIQGLPRGKILLLQNRAPFWSDKEISLYGYATMLLGIPNTASQIYYFAREDAASIPPYWFSEYQVDLGEPVVAAQKQNDIYFRNFEKGLVVVNPQANTQNVTFSTPHKTLSGESVQTLTLPPHQAVILLNP